MAEGFDLVSGGTDNHLMLVDLRKAGVTGKELEQPAGRGEHHRQQERHPQRPGEALRHQRHPGGHARRHHPRLQGSGHGGHRSIIWRTATDFEAKQDELRAQVAQLTGKYPLYE